MTKQNIRIIFVILALFAGYYLLTFICEIGVKCKNCDRYSMTMEESKEEGLFISEYRPIEKKVKLYYHQDSVEFTSVWAENSWFTNSDNCLFKKIEKSNGYNFFIEFKSYPSDNRNFFIHGNGFDSSITLGGKRGKIFELRDTLTFHTFEKNPDAKVGWRRELPGQDIKFVRINNVNDHQPKQKANAGRVGG